MDLDYSYSFLLQKLKLFMDEQDAIEVIDKAISSAGLRKKEIYDYGETDVIADELIKKGGFIEFVGRTIKISLTLKQNK